MASVNGKRIFISYAWKDGAALCSLRFAPEDRIVAGLSVFEASDAD